MASIESHQEITVAFILFGA